MSAEQRKENEIDVLVLRVLSMGMIETVGKVYRL
jgi:hypothetical protein